MTKDQFIENVFEIAFGDNAINKDYSYRSVLKRIKYYSDTALRCDFLNIAFTKDNIINLMLDIEIDTDDESIDIILNDLKELYKDNNELLLPDIIYVLKNFKKENL